MAELPYLLQQGTFNDKTDDYIVVNPDTEEISSPWARKNIARKITWSSRKILKLNSTNSDGKSIVTFGPDAHFARNITMIVNWPALEVNRVYADRVRVCYPNNLGFRPIIKFRLMLDGKERGVVERYSADAIHQFYRNPTTSEASYDCSLGRLPFLTEWSNSIPKWTTDIDVAFDLGSPDNPIELWATNDAHIEASIEVNIMEIIRMETLKDGEWVPIPPRPQYLINHGALREPLYPQFYCELGKVKKEELQNYMEESESRPIRRYFDHFVIKDDNTKAFGQVANLKIGIKQKCTAIMSFVTNVEYEAQHNTSNYTTNECLKLGWSPISRHALTHGDAVVHFDLPHEYLSRSIPRQNNLTSPVDDGFGIYLLGTRPTEPPPDLGYNFGRMDSSYRISIEDGSSFLKNLHISDHENLDDEIQSGKILEFSFENSKSQQKFIACLVLRLIKYYRLHRGEDGKFTHVDLLIEDSLNLP